MSPAKIPKRHATTPGRGASLPCEISTPAPMQVRSSLTKVARAMARSGGIARDLGLTAETRRSGEKRAEKSRISCGALDNFLFARSNGAGRAREIEEADFLGADSDPTEADG